MRTVYFQHIASFGYIVIGPWAIIYNPADSYKYCFCSCLFFIARWSLLMFFGIFKSHAHRADWVQPLLDWAEENLAPGAQVD